MRIFNAFFGAMMVPVAYLTAVQLKMSLMASLLTATMVLLGTVATKKNFKKSNLTTLFFLDNAYLTISRFILLDSMLLFFTCTSLYTLTTFHNLRYQ